MIFPQLWVKKIPQILQNKLKERLFKSITGHSRQSDICDATWSLRRLALGCMGDAATWKLASWKSVYVQRNLFEMNQDISWKRERRRNKLEETSTHPHAIKIDPPKTWKTTNFLGFTFIWSQIVYRTANQVTTANQGLQPGATATMHLKFHGGSWDTNGKQMIDWFFVMTFLDGCSSCLLMIIMVFTIIFANVRSFFDDCVAHFSSQSSGVGGEKFVT